MDTNWLSQFVMKWLYLHELNWTNDYYLNFKIILSIGYEITIKCSGFMFEVSEGVLVCGLF